MIRIKHIIQTLKIKALGEKKLFQIKLPKNAKRITGIQVTVTPLISKTSDTRATDATLNNGISSTDKTIADKKDEATDYLFGLHTVI